MLGGGYVNTELRELTEPRVFDYVDYITLDDGERAAARADRAPRAIRRAPLLRTFVRDGGAVVLRQRRPRCTTSPLRDAGTPTYDGLPLDRYLSLFEMLNPMHRLWSDGRWNKLTSRTAATGRSAASATSRSTTSRATTARRPTCWSIASRR